MRGRSSRHLDPKEAEPQPPPSSFSSDDEVPGGEGVRFDHGQASYVAMQIGDSVETTLRTYTHLFDEAEHAEQSRAAMDDSVGVTAKGDRDRTGGCAGKR